MIMQLPGVYLLTLKTEEGTQECHRTRGEAKRNPFEYLEDYIAGSGGFKPGDIYPLLYLET